MYNKINDSNEWMNVIMKIVKSLDKSGSKALKKQLIMQQKKKKDRFLGMFLSTLSATVVGDLLSGKGPT